MIKQILFIEDETHIAELYAMMLRKQDYGIDIVNDGGKGFEAAKTGKYDLLLLDIMLPTMSGIDILHSLHDPAKNPGTKVPPVVILTNMGEDDATVADIMKYAQGYLLKVNITPKQLVDYIDQLDKMLALNGPA